jgi:hypothetical protein
MQHPSAQHSSPTRRSQLEGHKLTYAIHFSIVPVVVTVIFRPMLWRPPAQLKDTRRLPQGEDAAKDAGFEDLLFIPDVSIHISLLYFTDNVCS